MRSGFVAAALVGAMSWSGVLAQAPAGGSGGAGGTGGTGGMGAAAAGQPGAKADRPAGATTLKPGDKAPPLAVTKWFNLLPTTQFEKGKVYVVLFWSHWQDESCRAMVHMAELVHAKDAAGEATYIAVHDLDEKSSLEQVEQWYNKRRASLHFSAGFDELHATTRAWMGAAGVSQTPTVFIVNRDGRLAFIGPARWLEGPLKAVVNGDWDAAAGGEKGESLVRELAARHEKMMGMFDKDPAGFVKEFGYFEDNYPLSVDAIRARKIDAMYRAGQGAQVEPLLHKLTHELSVHNDYRQMVEVANAILRAPPTGTRTQGEQVAARHLASVADQNFEGKDAAAKGALGEAWLIADAPEFAAKELRAGIALAADGPEKDRMRGMLAKAEAEMKKRERGGRKK